MSVQQPVRSSPQHVEIIRDAGRRLRDDGYTEAGICTHLDVREVPAPVPERLPLWRARTGGGTPLDLWIRLFLLGLTVPEGTLGAHLTTELIQDWHAVGLLATADGVTYAAVHLQVYRELLVASDFPTESGRECREDHVLGINKSTRTLADFAIPSEGGRLLDLGTGGGALALLGARHAAEAVGVDLLPRAVLIAERNAALNDATNVEFRIGDCFAPVEGETFERIVANPPFVISPESRFVFRDGQGSGDDFCRRLSRAAPTYLSEGGYFQMLANWAHAEGKDWRERLSAWFPEAGCDVLVQRAQTVPADEYAITWITTHSLDSPAELQARFDAWTAYFREQQIEAISLGLIAVKRTDRSASRIRFLEGAVRMNGPCGGPARRAINAMSLLELPDAQLLSLPLRLDPATRIRRLCQPGEVGWSDRMCWVERPHGLPHQETVSEPLAAALARCDGQVPLSELGAVMEQDDSLRALRNLLARGFFEDYSAVTQ